jgi:hypothetical protein
MVDSICDIGKVLSWPEAQSSLHNVKKKKLDSEKGWQVFYNGFGGHVGVTFRQEIILVCPAPFCGAR